MSITAVIANHNYAHYIEACLQSAAHFCDEVLVYDDGSTDESLDIIPEALLAGRRSTASGSALWAFNKGIDAAKCDYILFLDSDNYLVSRPGTEADYTYSDIRLVDGRDKPLGEWRYPGWPTTAEHALKNFHESASMPMPAGGAWRTAFLRENGCRWIQWKTSRAAADFRTYIEWLQFGPTIAYRPETSLVFRIHAAQSSQSPDKGRAMKEAALLARGYRL